MRIETKTTLGAGRYDDVMEVRVVNDDGSLIAVGTTRGTMWHKDRLPTMQYAACAVVKAMQRQLSEVVEVLVQSDLLDPKLM